MKRKVVSFSTIALVACAGMTPVTALAQTSETDTAEGTCPSVQMIAINDVNDSALGQSDAGFLGTVAAPVLASANDEDTADADLDGGFTAPAKTSTAVAPEQNNEWKPNVWGDAPATTSVQPGQSAANEWKPAMWDTTPTSDDTAGESEDKQATQESARQPETSEYTPTETSTTTAAKKNAPDVGRTIIEVESTDDTRAYIPGVTGPDTVPAYDESINNAVADTEAVLGKLSLIHI